MGSTNSLAFVCSTNLRRISHIYLNTSVSHRSSEVKWAVEPISRRCGLLGSVLSQRLHHHYTLIIIGKQIKCSSSESSEKLLSNTATNEDITGEQMKCFDKASSYRFVPSRPIWKRFDVGLQNELDQETDVSKIEDPMSSDNYDVFCIDRKALPKRTQLDLNTVKLLEQVSLIDFKGETTSSAYPVHHQLEGHRQKSTNVSSYSTVIIYQKSQQDY
ncbi:unnamed protein product [Heterobilharzia americana]|nr:unnamed protein product [Heterobilharzia americana]